MATPTPNPSGSTGKYSGGFTAGSSSAPKAKKVAAPKTTPTQDLINGTVSIGQGILNAAMTPMYAVEDAVWRTIHNAKDPNLQAKIAKSGGFLNWFGKQAAGVGEAATNWTRGQEVKHTGGAIAKELGLISSGTDFWSKAANTAIGLGFDIALDPVTYIPVADVMKVIEGVSRGGAALTKGAVAGTKGMISTSRAIEQGVTGKIIDGNAIAKTVTPKYSRIAETKLRPATERTQAAVKGRAFNAELGAGTTHLVVNPDAALRTTREVANDAIATGLEMGMKALRGTLLSHNANKFLDKYAADLAKAAKKGKASPEVALPAVTKAAESAPKVAEDVAPKAVEAPAASVTTDVLDRINKGQAPFLDAAPSAYEKAMVTLGTKDIGEVQKILKRIDNAAKKVTGKTLAGGDKAERIWNLIKAHGDRPSRLLDKLPEAKRAELIQYVNESPLFALSDLSGKADAVGKWAERVSNATIQLTNGPTNISRLIKNKVKFHELSQADRHAIIDHITMSSDAYSASKKLFQSIDSISGNAELSKALKDAGILSPTAETVAKVKTLLQDFAATDTSQTIHYTSAADLIAGLRAKHVVSAEDLKKVLKALDPKNKLVTDIEKKIKAANPQELASVLLGDGAETLNMMQQRVELTNTVRLLESSGLAFADVLAAYLDARFLGTLDKPEPVVAMFTRKNASEALRTMSADTMHTVTTILRETFGERWAEAEKMAADGKTFTSDLGDITTTNATKKYEGAAILADQMGNGFQNVLVGKFTGIGTFRAAKAATGESLPKARMFVNFMEASDNTMVAITGNRMTTQIYRSAVGSDAMAEKHVLFLHMGDIVDTMINGAPEAQKALLDAFFITDKGVVKTDSLDTMSMLEVMRKVIEDRSKGVPLDMPYLYGRAGYKAKDAVLSKTFAKRKDEIAKTFVDHLVSEPVISKLEEIHKNKALAMVEDHTVRSMDLLPQVASLMKKAYQAGLDENWLTAEDQFMHVRDLFNRFTYLSGIFENTNGAVASSVFKAASWLFIKNGKVLNDTGDALDEVFKLLPEAKTQMDAEIQKVLNTYARHEVNALEAPVGREHFKAPNPDVLPNVKAEYQAAKDAFEMHIASAATKLTDKEAFKQWSKDGKAILKNLEKARRKAFINWLDVEHYSNVHGRWVKPEAYDLQAELQWAKDHPAQMIGDTIERPATEMVDTGAKLKAEKATPAEKAAAKKAGAEAKAKKSQQISEATIEDAAVETMAKAQEIASTGLDEADQGIRTLQEFYNQQILLRRPDEYFYSLKNTKQNSTLAQRISENMNVAGGKGPLTPYLQLFEARLRTTESQLAHAVQRLLKEYPDQMRDSEVFAEAFSKALQDGNPVIPADHEVAAFENYVNQLVSFITKSADLANLNPEVMKKALADYGLKDSAGFVYNGNIPEMMANMPWGKIPEGVADPAEWAKRASDFKESGMTPGKAILNIGNAIQHAALNQQMAESLVSNFGWKAAGFKSAQAARNAGFVELKSSKSSLLAGMPSAEKGALFHPEIARNIAAVDRAKESLLNGPRAGKIVNTMMLFTSYIKFFQTSLNPRHHITNLLGDTSMELMAGTVNPVHWKLAIDISNEFARNVLKTDYAHNAMDASLARLFATLETPEELAKTLVAYTKRGDLEVPLKINGKDVPMDVKTLATLFGRYNIATSGIYNDEILGAYEMLTADKLASGTQREMQKGITTKLKLGIEKGMKPFGDFSSAYSNVPRIAGAIRVMTSKEWKSEQEMWNAVADHVHLYHPTISSLAPAERRYGRLIFGYYTWLRGAHNAFLDLAVNHTAAAMITPKLLSNVRQQNDVQQISPGTPWGPGMAVPQNMKGKLYGPLYNTNMGATGIELSNPFMDVAQTWQFYYDPMLNGEQMTGENIKVLGSFLGGSANPVARQIAQEMVGTDFQTGKQLTDRTPSAAMDRFFQTLGPSQLAQALDIYTPMGKTVTPEQRAQKGRKYFLGTKEFSIGDPGITKAYNMQTSARLKTFLKNLNQGK